MGLMRTLGYLPSVCGKYLAGNGVTKKHRKSKQMQTSPLAHIDGQVLWQSHTIDAGRIHTHIYIYIYIYIYIFKQNHGN